MLFRIIAAALLVGASMAAAPTSAQAEPRLGLVIGQGAYGTGELPTAANDAGLVGQTLTSAGFEVVQGRDLNQADLRRIIRDDLRRSLRLLRRSRLLHPCPRPSVG